LATVSQESIPESAFVGIAVTPDLKIIFDTIADTRKHENLLLNPNISFVVGWNNDRTLQYQGIAKIPTPTELENLLPTFFEIFPEKNVKNENLREIAYFYVEPTWIRYSDLNEDTRQIEEMSFK
jgi:hypothetical protein